MSKIVLISCAKSQLGGTHCAIDIYKPSLLYSMSLAYAKTLKPDKIFILSSKHGLLEADEKIEKYDVPLKKPKFWTNRVLDKLKQVSDIQQDEFVLLASIPYYKYLKTHLKNYNIPMEGLKRCEKKQWLKEQLSAAIQHDDTANSV
jgi:hypothetical protein